MAKTSLIVSLIGDDRPGLIEQFSKTIADQDASWVDSRMTELCGKFAGLFRVETDTSKMSDVKSAIEAFASDSMKIIIEDIGDVKSAPAVQYNKIEIMGHDQVGIVREVSRSLLEENINISDLHSEIITAPHSGDQIFKATVTFENKEQHSEKGLQEKLDKIADELSLEIKLL